jgi:DNA-binding HxlR family transcriptional regulator/putative sterol carrier protein
MTKRSYGQYCAVARGLDIIGDRWMLLIIRDLLLGPRRYKDLLAGLPGIGTNLLAARLRQLEEAGLVERAVLPPPAGSSVYQLTGAGEALEPVIIAIGRWGARFLGQPRSHDVLLPRAYFVAIRSGFRPDRAADLAETYEFRIGELVFTVGVAGGRCTTREGPATDPDAVIGMDVNTLSALLLEGLPPRAALADGRIAITGDPGCLDRFVDMFALRQASAQL